MYYITQTVYCHPLRRQYNTWTLDNGLDNDLIIAGNYILGVRLDGTLNGDKLPLPYTRTTPNLQRRGLQPHSQAAVKLIFSGLGMRLSS